MIRVRPLGLSALFASIVQACGGGDSSTSDSITTSATGGFCDPQDHEITVPGDAVAGADLTDGMYPAALCMMLCAEFLEFGEYVQCGPIAAAVVNDFPRTTPSAGGPPPKETTSSADESTGGGDSTVGGGSSDGGGTTGAGGSSDGDGSGDSIGSEGTGGGPPVDILCTVQPSCPGGRVSADLCSDGVVEAKGSAAWFATMAHSEAASVVSFLRLAAALAEHGAPLALRDACRIAARDEARHARIMRGLARAKGVTARRPRHAPARARSLEALAIENAVEGCVHETWAALEATWQARHAAEPRVRAAMTEIATDERRHAELAWAIDAWMRGRLAPDAWSRVHRARADAVDALIDRVGHSPGDSSLGVPDGRSATRMAAALRDELWSVSRLARRPARSS